MLQSPQVGMIVYSARRQPDAEALVDRADPLDAGHGIETKIGKGRRVGDVAHVHVEDVRQHLRQNLDQRLRRGDGLLDRLDRRRIEIAERHEGTPCNERRRIAGPWRRSGRDPLLPENQNLGPEKG